MTEAHGQPLKDEAAFDALPRDVQDAILADVELLRSNLPPDELPDDQPVGIGSTSGGYLVLRVGHAAYQLTADGATLKASGGPKGLMLTTYRNGEIIDGPTAQ